MGEYVYTLVPANLKSFLEKIQSAGIPEKLTTKVLESLGFKSKNERVFIPIMKALGFISAEGVPQDRWKRFRDKSIARTVLAEGIRGHYESLFKMYPDAHHQDNEALTNFFSTQTSLGAKAVASMVRTFRALAENADFESSVTTPPPSREAISGQPPAGAPIRTQISDQGIVININIQFTLPDTTNSDTFEAIFKALKKQLLSQE